MVLLCFQLWDIRDGMCKQTFSGHESDINAITVSVCHAYYESMAVYGPFYLQLCASWRTFRNVNLISFTKPIL